MKHFRIRPRLFLYVFLAFIGCTVIGTLSHEAGHVAVAKYFGYETRLSYGSMHWNKKPALEELRALAAGHSEKMCNKEPFPGRQAFEAKRRTLHRHTFLIRLGGPLQTMLTGTIGFMILLYRRKKYPLLFNIWDWTAVFLAFFWIRQPCNVSLSVLDRILDGHGRWFGGDERVISLYLKIPSGTVSIITGILGGVILTYVVFVMIPKKHRLTFITAGITGGVTGFMLWMDCLGPYVLP